MQTFEFSVNGRHIMEDLDGQIKKPTDPMTEDEMQFHYFKVHDYNDDNKLDGIEIIAALTHHNGLSLLLICIVMFLCASPLSRQARHQDFSIV